MGIHNDEVHVVPESFFITASSPSCQVQGMENEQGDRFGLQFHRVNDSEFGKMFNFLSKSVGLIVMLKLG